MSTNMGNLEKLGILVIVILVVVVGVVAITPKSTVDDRLMPDGQIPSETAKAPEPLEPLPGQQPGVDPKAPVDPWPSGGAVAGAQQKLPGGEILAADPAAKPPAPAAAEAQPTTRTVKVQSGDTLATIAKRELGAAARYPEILKANPGLVATRLKKGQEIKIPVATAKAAADEPTALTPVVPSPAPGVTPAPGMVPAPVDPEPTASEKVYVVKSGDTLSAIAGREMGAKSKWTELQKANEDVLHGSTALKVGMKLRIPAGGKSADTSSNLAPSASGSEASSGGSAEHEYVVKPGDTLSLIARTQLGSEKLVGTLREANADVLKGSDNLRVGTKLTIPAKK